MAMQRIIQLTQPVSEGDHIRGPQSAEVSLVEYGDFECPYCRAAEPIVSGLIEALEDRLSVTFRHFPLSQVHSRAGHAAEVAEAAASQGKFWEMHDTLFARQDALDDADLLKYAAELSLGLGPHKPRAGRS
jgi:protein-disulfide isomerase